MPSIQNGTHYSDSMDAELKTQLSNWLTQQTGQPFNCQTASAASGGCIHRSYILADGKRSYFIKINRAAKLDVFEVAVLPPGVGPVDRAAARIVGHLIVVEGAVEDQYARCAGAAEELVGREEDGVEPFERIVGVSPRKFRADAVASRAG